MNSKINFPLAKLLREKGYPFEFITIGEENEVPLNIPTIIEVVMWIYEKYGIWISVQKDWGYGLGLGFEAIIDVNDGYINTETFLSPAEACSAAIENILNNLI